METEQFHAKRWLNEFLNARKLDIPDGRSLFAYQASPEEFHVLEKGLTSLVVQSQRWSYTTPFDLWDKDYHAAVFVLYAALCWQQSFDGSSWTWNFILTPLGIPSEISHGPKFIAVIKAGLTWWGLKPNEQGYTYLGAIAREAGLPLKLLTEDKGIVGRILRTVLRVALQHDAPATFVSDWIRGYQNDLPQSYRKSAILELLANTVHVCIELKKELQAQTVEDACAELDIRIPDWRMRFPLPLNNAVANDILTSLLKDVVQKEHTHSTSKPVSVRRCLEKDDSGLWRLSASIDFPSVIRLETPPSIRLLGLRLFCGEEEQHGMECLLRRHPRRDGYVVPNDLPWRFHGQRAASDINLRYAANGFRYVTGCPGGGELDQQLPWIFEAESFGCEFRHQGGGSVRGQEALVALAPGWSADNGEYLGELQGFERGLWRVRQEGIVSNSDQNFRVRMNKIDTEINWEGSRFWELNMIRPVLAFKGSPQVPASGTLYWKKPGMPYESLGHPDPGVVQVRFQSRSGASLQNTMLLLPSRASFRLEAIDDTTGQIHLEHWQVISASLHKPQPGLTLDYHKNESCLTIVLHVDKNALPPAEVEVSLLWADSPQDAVIRFPFPQKGARLFDSEQQLIPTEELLCVTRLHGLRLYCLSVEPYADMRLRLSPRTDTSACNGFEFPLSLDVNGITEFRLIDWQDLLVELLALGHGLQAQVRLEVLSKGKPVARWYIARYDKELCRGEDEVFLPVTIGTPRPELCAVLLARPNLEPRKLPLLPDDGSCLRWSIEPLKDYQGPWLIFDTAPGASMRPLLWNILNGTALDSPDLLQRAITAEDETRAQAFQTCIDTMLHEPSAPEWQTLGDLLSALKSLPLSTLEVWSQLSCSPLAMAMLALRPEVDFSSISSRVSIELPFLWNFVSQKEWYQASQSILQYFRKFFQNNEEAAVQFWLLHIQTRIDEISTFCPSISALVHISIPLPEYQNQLEKVSKGFSVEAIHATLFSKDSNSSLQKLLILHADDDWPEDFTTAVKKAAFRPELKKFFPDFTRQGSHTISVTGLPFLLILQAFSVQPNLLPMPNDPHEFGRFFFALRKHITFDPDWFDEASFFSACCCLAEGFVQE